ncbi:MAG TPA: response regulator [Candidatus Angelobacter sp.]|nr:response regulator [Candidatus Angelobacter sp.]
MKQALLVDDNASQLLMREMVLRRGAIECHAASSPRGALALMRTEVGRLNIGVVITDHLMPAMTGAEFVRQLREFNQEVPVIVISGLPEADAEYDGLNVIFRMKPIEPEDLILLVRRVLEWAEPHQASA